jgi:UDP-N-acetylmuramyl pentapeptide phosphotransferase/UDP-N-acetylglucosamine-1-phosphate transferase
MRLGDLSVVDWLPFILTFFASIVLTIFMMRINITDMPNERSSHARPTPKSGGIAIALSFYIGMLYLYFYDSIVIHQQHFWLLMAASFVMLTIAFLDDKREIKPLHKIIGQIFAAWLITYGGISINMLPIPLMATIGLPPIIDEILTICWVIFFLNAFNFMDGINGIASGTALIACLFLGMIAYAVNADYVFYGCVILFMAILGFFLFNFPFGKIFMGDTGTQFIAFVITMLGLEASVEHIGISFYVLPLVFSLFIYDVGLTIIRRLGRRENIFKAHRSHLYQLLNRAGMPHTKVTMIYLAFAAIGGALALFNFYYGYLWLVLLLTLIYVVGFSVFVSYYAKKHNLEITQY